MIGVCRGSEAEYCDRVVLLAPRYPLYSPPVPVVEPSLHAMRVFLFLVFLTLAQSGRAVTTSEEGEDPRPNILLLVADDLGYADLGCYGGDIETPHIDALAARGLRFSRFHIAALCAPTRSMLLSGNDNHIAGMGIQHNGADEFGYEGHLTDRIVPVPQLLRDAGYHTYMAGKWHLGYKPEHNPHRKGFEHSFVNLDGAGNHYDDQGWEEGIPIARYTEDGRKAGWPKGTYSTDLFTDKIIGYIDRHADDGKPFFAFAAYTSPHWPLQVDEPYWRKYEGRYDEGYEVLKMRRMESFKKAGMSPEDAVIPPPHDRVKPWDSLSPNEQEMEARKMELYAGMVDNLDHNIGRMITYLKSIGEYENTLIVFMADNGAAAEDFIMRIGRRILCRRILITTTTGWANRTHSYRMGPSGRKQVQLRSGILRVKPRKGPSPHPC